MSRAKLDPQREKYAQHRAKGVGRQQSAVLAGYADHNGAGAQVEESVDVQVRIQELQKEAAENTKTTKEDVVEGLRAAAELARLQADPGGMVMAWKELGKMLGFYAPEVKKLEKGINKSDLRRALEELKDEDLLALSQGRVIDGQFKRINEQAPAQLPDLQKK